MLTFSYIANDKGVSAIAADLIIKSMETTIAAKTVTYDFERLMQGATLLSCSAFADALVDNMLG